MMVMDVIFYWVESFAANTILIFTLFCLLGLANVFIPPIPIETLTLFGGYLSGSGHGNAFIMWVSVVTGMSVGGIVLFMLAQNAGDRLLQLPLIRNQLGAAGLQRARQWFNRYGVWAIYIGKLVPGMSFATILASGLFDMGKRSAYIAICMANAIYFAIVLYLGYNLGEQWPAFTALWQKYNEIIIVLLLLAAVICSLYMLRRKYQSDRSHQ